MFWKLFSSERKIQEALEKSQGYDISPDAPPSATPEAANGNAADEEATFDFSTLRTSDNRIEEPTESSNLEIWTDYASRIPANTEGKKKSEFFGIEYEEAWEQEKIQWKKG